VQVQKGSDIVGALLRVRRQSNGGERATLLGHMTEPAAFSLSDGVITIRPPEAGDAVTLIAGRDEEFHRWLGPGAEKPAPVACVVVDGEIVGWVDYDDDRHHDWLEAGEVNVGYHLFARHRGNGYATRAVELLMQHLAEATDKHTASLLIHPQNERSLAVARRAGFAPCDDVNDQRYFRRAVRPIETRS
jgi:RimJ/RimL family protein N-acetyltransferase